jgi:hypothetical protein
LGRDYSGVLSAGSGDGDSSGGGDVGLRMTLINA